ncbi:hypothetical protein KP806_07910 [Paenibacillus sp. N4]|uniref:hypothetical protein n=1 Tax=Paenibacillus vietnamensis TaxID=2590547 RepID=UPI001CD0D368|nr:hypothetical protein [Paenibacillus vietnamensis]MCA0754973.1 hypothetical protein [Paenibacillus vietnamensis]
MLVQLITFTVMACACLTDVSAITAAKETTAARDDNQQNEQYQDKTYIIVKNAAYVITAVAHYSIHLPKTRYVVGYAPFVLFDWVFVM